MTPTLKEQIHNHDYPQSVPALKCEEGRRSVDDEKHAGVTCGGVGRSVCVCKNRRMPPETIPHSLYPPRHTHTVSIRLCCISRFPDDILLIKEDNLCIMYKLPSISAACHLRLFLTWLCLVLLTPFANSVHRFAILTTFLPQN